MKRALALIDSKMNQAKGWLRDPNAPPGNNKNNKQTKKTHSVLINFFFFFKLWVIHLCDAKFPLDINNLHVVNHFEAAYR